MITGRLKNCKQVCLQTSSIKMKKFFFNIWGWSIIVVDQQPQLFSLSCWFFVIDSSSVGLISKKYHQNSVCFYHLLSFHHQPGSGGPQHRRLLMCGFIYFTDLLLVGKNYGGSCRGAEGTAVPQCSVPHYCFLMRRSDGLQQVSHLAGRCLAVGGASLFWHGPLSFIHKLE